VSRVKDVRNFKYSDYEAHVRTRSTPTDVYKTIELPLMAFADLGLKVHTVEDKLVIEQVGCKHTHTTEVGEFMLTGHECDDCGERIYS